MRPHPHQLLHPGEVVCQSCGNAHDDLAAAAKGKAKHDRAFVEAIIGLRVKQDDGELAERPKNFAIPNSLSGLYPRGHNPEKQTRVGGP